MGELEYKTRGFTNEDIEESYKLFNKYSKDVGFVMKPSIRERARRRNLIVVKEEDVVVAVCNFNVRKKDKVGVIYEIVVDESFRGNGIGFELVNMVRARCLYIRLKCPVDNESNYFYGKVGFTKLGVEKGKKRDLNIWGILGK